MARDGYAGMHELKQRALARSWGKELRNVTHVVMGYNRACGDRITMSLCISNGVYTAIALAGSSCMLGRAAANFLADMLEGQPVGVLHTVSYAQLAAVTGGPLGPTRELCVRMVWGLVEQLCTQVPC